MAFIFANPNPKHQLVGDCVIRAIALATGKDWEQVYSELAVYGFMSCDMPSSNAVWGQYLTDLGFERGIVYDPCPIRDFAARNNGVFVLGTGTHAVCCMFGDYYDTWDSGDEEIICIWRLKKHA